MCYNDFFLDKEVFSIEKAHSSLCTFEGAAASLTLEIGVSKVFILQVDDLVRFSTLVRHYFSTYQCHRSEPGFSAACYPGH